MDITCMELETVKCAFVDGAGCAIGVENTPFISSCTYVPQSPMACTQIRNRTIQPSAVLFDYTVLTLSGIGDVRLSTA